jgi:hypothetical protein
VFGRCVECLDVHSLTAVDCVPVFLPPKKTAFLLTDIFSCNFSRDNCATYVFNFKFPTLDNIKKVDVHTSEMGARLATRDSGS